MNSERIRIIIVDDHQLVRKSWKMLLESNPSIRVVGESANSEDAFQQVQILLPDIILADFNNKPQRGFEFAEKISSITPTVKLICLSVKKGTRFVARMMTLGARGYLTKTTSLEEIQRGILQVYRGERYICEELVKSALAQDLFQ